MKIKSKYIYPIILFVCVHLSPTISSSSQIDPHPNRSGFKIPSNVRYLCCRPLQNAHILSVCCAFSSACALLSNAIWYFETTSIKIPIFQGGYSLKEHFDASNEIKSVTYRLQANNPPTEVLEFYDAYFNGSGWRSAFETCQRNWEYSQDSKYRAEPIFRQLYASWAHPEKNLKAVLWLIYEAENNASQNEVVVRFQLYPETSK